MIGFASVYLFLLGSPFNPAGEWAIDPVSLRGMEVKGAPHYSLKNVSTLQFERSGKFRYINTMGGGTWKIDGNNLILRCTKHLDYFEKLGVISPGSKDISVLKIDRKGDRLIWSVKGPMMKRRHEWILTRITK